MAPIRQTVTTSFTRGRGGAPTAPAGRIGRPGVRVAAMAAAVLLLARFPAWWLLPQDSASPPVRELSALLGAAPHLLLFPVVAAVLAPAWGRSAGYGWLAIDIATDVMAVNGVPAATFLPLRYGGHVAAALWIAATSWQARGTTRTVGLLLALDLGGYSFAAPFVSFVGLLPALVLLPVWLVLASRQAAHQ